MKEVEVSKLFDTSQADILTRLEHGVHKECGAGTSRPVAFDVKITTHYNANATYQPWGYRLHFPNELGFVKFLTGAGYIGPERYSFNGYDVFFETSEEAEQEAIKIAKSVANKYYEYLKAQEQAKEYTLTLPLDSDDDKE